MNFTISAEIKLISISVDFFSKWATQDDKKNSLRVLYIYIIFFFKFKKKISHLKCSWNFRKFGFLLPECKNEKKKNIHQEDVRIVKVLW